MSSLTGRNRFDLVYFPTFRFTLLSVSTVVAIQPVLFTTNVASVPAVAGPGQAAELDSGITAFSSDSIAEQSEVLLGQQLA